MEIQSSVVNGDVLHFATLPGDLTAEGWGYDGIVSILDNHVDHDLVDTTIAKDFYKMMGRHMEGDFEMVVTVDATCDVRDIRIRREDESYQYIERFDLFESSAWVRFYDVEA